MSGLAARLPRGPWIVLIALVVLGVFFRFYNLGGKAYWYDEVFTLLRISGHTEAEVLDQAFNNQTVRAESLQKFQRPSSEKGLSDTVRTLQTQEPQLTPLYFVAARLWAEAFGVSAAPTRSLTAIFGVLVLLCVYWLCLELFESSLVALAAVALVAISPVQVLYAQDARPYSLWTATSVLSCIALLRAIRTGKRSDWAFYALALAASLYTHLFTALIAVAHAIYVIAIEKFRVSKVLIAYSLASLAAFLAFLPWLVVPAEGFLHAAARSPWGRTTLYIPHLFAWVADYSRVFFDVNVNRLSDPILFLAVSPVALVVVALLMFSFYFVWKNSARRVSLFVLIMAVMPPLVLMLVDVLLAKQLSINSRYMLPGYIFSQICVAYLIVRKLEAPISRAARRFWSATGAALIAFGIVSCAVSSQAPSWWNKGHAPRFLEVANIANREADPLIVGSASGHDDFFYAGSILWLSHFLDADVKLRLSVLPELPEAHVGAFVFELSSKVRESFAKHFELEAATPHKSPWLWKVTAHKTE